MKRTPKILHFLIALLLSGITICHAQAKSPVDKTEYRIIEINEGDSITAKTRHIEISLRLAGINIPEAPAKNTERQRPFGEIAMRYLERRILNKVVYIKAYGLERYDRIWGVIYLDAVNINLEMVRAGLAEVYRGESPRCLDVEPFLKAEKEAREANKGMWSLGDKYTSPKEWRSIHRGK